MALECRTIPGRDAVPGTPSRVEITPNLGWNSGARSIARIDGACRLEFTMPQVTGAVCGLATTHRGTEPSGIDFGLQFETAGLGAVCRALEAGRPVSDWIAYTPGVTVFRVDRQPGGRMVAQAGAVTLAVSEALQLEALITVGCLYAATDQIG